MKTHTFTHTLLATTLLIAGGALAPAQAAIITSVSSVATPGGTSTGSIGSFGITPAPNNDDAPGPNPNGFSYNYFVNAPGLLEVEFNVADSGGTSEYAVGGSMLNLTQTPWTNFKFELGFGTGANFVRSGLLDFLDFDTPNGAPTSNAFGTLNYQPDVLVWTNGSVGFIKAAQFSFSIDVPDGLKGFNPYGQSRFTLRQIPNAPPEPAAVPEPTSLALLGSGLLGLVARARKRRNA